jgi:hypothetical protein
VKKIAGIMAGALLLTAWTYSPACAEGGKIRFGNLALIPSLGLSEVYDDNIYYAKDNQKSDWITHVRPGLMLDYTIQGRGKVKLGYGGDYASYSKYDANDWKNHTGLFDLNYEAPGGLIVKINNVYLRCEDPYGSETQYKQGIKTKRWVDGLTNAVGFKFSERLKLFAFYNFHKESYDNKEDFAQDYTSSELGTGAEVKITHKTWIFLRYHYGGRNYYSYRDGVTSSNDADYDWHRVNTGLVWDEGGHYGGELNLGYQWNNYKNTYDANGNRYKEENSWIAATAVEYRQTVTRTFRLRLLRALRQYSSGQSGYFTETSLGLGVSQQIRTKYEVDAGYEFKKYDFTGPNGSYSSTGSSNFISDGLGSQNKENRAYVSLNYFIREWLTAGVHYEFEKNNANPRTASYTVNRFMFTLDFIPAFYH